MCDVAVCGSEAQCAARLIRGPAQVAIHFPADDFRSPTAGLQTALARAVLARAVARTSLSKFASGLEKRVLSKADRSAKRSARSAAIRASWQAALLEDARAVHSAADEALPASFMAVGPLRIKPAARTRTRGGWALEFWVEPMCVVDWIGAGPPPHLSAAFARHVRARGIAGRKAGADDASAAAEAVQACAKRVQELFSELHRWAASAQVPADCSPSEALSATRAAWRDRRKRAAPEGVEFACAAAFAPFRALRCSAEPQPGGAREHAPSVPMILLRPPSSAAAPCRPPVQRAAAFPSSESAPALTASAARKGKSATSITRAIEQEKQGVRRAAAQLRFATRVALLVTPRTDRLVSAAHILPREATAARAEICENARRVAAAIVRAHWRSAVS